MTSDRDSIWYRYRNLLRRRTREEVDDELRFHLEMRAQEARRAGLSDGQAMAAATERFGEVRAVEAELLRMSRVRERRRARREWGSDLRQDATFALRSLRRAPAFTSAAIATLAIAIGANTVIYSVVYALLIAPLPFGHPEQLVTTAKWGYSNGELLALRERFRSATGVAAYGLANANLDDSGDAERVVAASTTANFFSLLERAPLIGRTFAPDESDAGKNHVVVLSEWLWRTRFGGDTAIIGRRLLIDATPTLVIGVMPADFAFPSARTALWMPFTFDRTNPVSMWASAGHTFVLRLRSGISTASARRELHSLAVSLRHANTIWDPGPDYGKEADLVQLQQSLVGSARPELLMLLGCAAMVLLIACANVANLLLARATARDRELSVRAVLGGGRARLIRLLLTESLLLSCIGGGVGIVLAEFGVRWLVAHMPAGVPRASEIHLSGPAVVLSAFVSIATGIAFGILPAWRATARRTNSAVRSGRASQGESHQRIAAALVMGEVALAVLLAVGAELLVRSFDGIRHVDPGFRTTALVSARVTPSAKSYPQRERVDELYSTILMRLKAVPGVTHVGAVSALPLSRPNYGMAIRVEGQFEDYSHTLPMLDHFASVTPDFMAATGMRILAGRAFTDDDRADAEPVAIISQSTARRYWPGGDALGKHIGYPYKSPWIRVVGIVADIANDSLRDTRTMAAYVPFAQRTTSLGAATDLTIVASVAGDGSVVRNQLRAIVAGVDRTVPVSEILTMDEVVARSMAKERFVVLLVGGFALVALVLGSVGIYGVMSYVVSQRTRELCVRAALGASTGMILGMVVRRAATLAGTGALVGIALAAIALRPMRAMLYGVSVNDPATYAVVATLFIGVAVAASAAPARRAARTDPASALRAD